MLVLLMQKHAKIDWKGFNTKKEGKILISKLYRNAFYDKREETRARGHPLPDSVEKWSTYLAAFVPTGEYLPHHCSI